MSKHVLIIGGTRFIGRSICKILASNGFTVHVLHRGFHPAQNCPEGIIEHLGNAKNPLEYKQLFKKYSIEFIIHTIAYAPEDLESLLPILKSTQIPLVVISTGQVYLVTVPRKSEYKETDYNRLLMQAPLNEEDFNQWEYGIQKRNMENLLTRWHEEYGISALTLRSPVVQGKNDYSYRLFSYIARLQDQEPIVLPHQGNTIISHIWVEDLARAILAIVNKGFTGRFAYNISMQERFKLSEVLQQMSEILQINKKAYISTRELSEQEDKILRTASPYSGKWVSVLNAEAFKKDFEWSPTPFSSWFPEVVLYQAKNFYLDELKNYGNRPKEVEIFKKLEKKGQLEQIL